MKFIIIHGSFGHPGENWFPYLKQELENLDQEVIVPKFPVEDWQEITNQGQEKARDKNQNLNNWLQIFENEVIPEINTTDQICMIGHSLGPLFILHITEKFEINLDSAIFASPFLSSLDEKLWQIELVNSSFYKTDFDFEKLKKQIPTSYVLYADNDPYIPQKSFKEFAQKLNSSTIKIKSGGHLNEEAGYKKFPLVLELCKTRLG